MIETELKSSVPDLDAACTAVRHAGARLVFEGELEDRRYDTPDRQLLARDEVLRTRVYRVGARAHAQLDWKGPTSLAGGYKQREERSTVVSDPEQLAVILEQLGFVVSMAIDRYIWQYEIDGATVRFERYPRMDDLVEVEGPPDAIERAIEHTALPAPGCTG